MSPTKDPHSSTPLPPEESNVGAQSPLDLRHRDGRRGNRSSSIDSLLETEAEALRFWSTGVRVMRLARLVHRCALEQAAWIDRTFLTARAAAVLSREAMLAGGVRAFLMEHGLEPRDLLVEASEAAWQRLTPWVSEAIQDIHLENEEAWAASGSSGDAFGLLPPVAQPGAKERVHCSGLLGRALRTNSHAYLVHVLALRRDQTLAATVRFHRLPRWTRQAAQAVLCEGRSVEECLRMGLGPRERLLREIRRGLDALLLVEGLWPTDDRSDPTDGGGSHGAI